MSREVLPIWVGTRFGRLVVLRRHKVDGLERWRGRFAWWWCRCECGSEGAYRGVKLRAGEVGQCRECGWTDRHSRGEGLSGGKDGEG